MPYNPSTGVYSLPAIYLAVPGTVIIAAQHNTPLVDLQTANNYERPIIAGGTGAGSIAGTVANFSLVQYTAQVLDETQKAQVRENIGSATAGVFEQKNANYLVVAEDLGKTFLFTASATVTFDPAADLGANFECEIWANFGVTLTLDPSAAETINGAATLILQPGDKLSVWCNGTALFAKASGDPLVGPQLQGYFTGLTLTTNAGDATNDVDIAVGAAASDVSPYYLMQLTSALTKRIDSNWVVGTNQGGLDTGAVANSTYYIWLIQRSDTLVTDVLFSLSSTAPTMPTSYDRKRLIGGLTRTAGVNSAPNYLLDASKKVRATVNFNGTGTLAIREAYNILGVTDNGVGLFAPVFETPAPNANYIVNSSARALPADSFASVNVTPFSSSISVGVTPTTAGFAIRCNVPGANQVYDPDYVMLSVIW